MKLGYLVLASFSVLLCACSNMTRYAPDQGKLLATGGVSQVEGAGGAGLTSWATISGYGSDNSFGANAFYTQSNLPDFEFRALGASVGIANRVELSYANQQFDTGDTGPALGLPQGYTFEQDIYGAKLRVFGDAVYDQDSWKPQVSVGLNYKKAKDAPLLTALGAKDDEGVDYYVAATKIFLDKSLLVGGTVRATKANQFGLLGFGGDQNDDYNYEFEGSVAYMVSRKLVIGADYRTKPDNLGFAEEQDGAAIYAAYFPNKHISITGAYVDLGNIATRGKQDGAYLSLQVGF